MGPRPSLHILFTMTCEAVVTRKHPIGPRTWEQSARSLEGYCDCLLAAGYPPTLFVDPTALEEHGPMLEELASRGVDVGVYVHPPSLSNGSYNKNLGQYKAEEQQAMIEVAVERARAAVDLAPRSFRTGNYSASDDTIPLAFEEGFRQGSVSQPGRALPREAASWTFAAQDPHYVNPANKLERGTLPFLEIPVTTDADRIPRTGVPSELTIESGTVDQWHRPLAEAQLERMERDGAAFRTLCISTLNRFPYHDPSDKHGAILRDLVAYIDQLTARYEVTPHTLASAHEHYRKLGLE